MYEISLLAQLPCIKAACAAHQFAILNIPMLKMRSLCESGHSMLGKHLRVTLIAALCCFVTAAWGQSALPRPTPLLKNGSCPSNYSSEGKYCVPGSMAKFAIPKTGSCPSNYSSEGSYCVASGMAKIAIIKEGGSCPSNYASEGSYCVSSR